VKQSFGQAQFNEPSPAPDLKELGFVRYGTDTALHARLLHVEPTQPAIVVLVRAERKPQRRAGGDHFALHLN
jgi:hypothetical protein